MRGGGASVVLDTLHLGSVGGELRWESPDFAAAEERYDVEVLGGVSKIVLARRA